MLATTTSSGVRFLADRYKDLAPFSYTNLCALMTYFLMGCSSLSELVRRVPWTHSVSDLSRAVAEFPGNRFMRRMRGAILKHYDGDFDPQNFIFAVDDTANPKYGKTIFRIGHWHGSTGPWYGQKLVVLALIDTARDFALPLAFIIATKKGSPDYQSGHDIAADLLRQAIGEGFPKLAVVVDSWFDSVELIAAIKQMGLVYAGELKRNRKARRNPGEHVTWKSLGEVFGGLPRSEILTRYDNPKIREGKRRPKVAAQTRLWLRNFRSALNGIAVYNRRNGKEPFGYYVTTDLSMSRARLWEISRARWRIESLFRDLKQNLSLGRLPCGGENSADLAVCIPMLILVSLRLHGEEVWKTRKAATIGDMVDQIREQLLTRSIEHLLQRRTTHLVKKLRSRRSPERINRKPVDQAAEVA